MWKCFFTILSLPSPRASTRSEPLAKISPFKKKASSLRLGGQGLLFAEYRKKRPDAEGEGWKSPPLAPLLLSPLCKFFGLNIVTVGLPRPPFFFSACARFLFFGIHPTTPQPPPPQGGGAIQCNTKQIIPPFLSLPPPR